MQIAIILHEKVLWRFYVSLHTIRIKIMLRMLSFVAHERWKRMEIGRTRACEKPELLTGVGPSFRAIYKYLDSAWLRRYLSNYTATCNDTRPDCLWVRGSSSCGCWQGGKKPSHWYHHRGELYFALQTWHVDFLLVIQNILLSPPILRDCI